MLALTIAGWWWLLLAVGAALLIGVALIRFGGREEFMGWPGRPLGCIPALLLLVLAVIVGLLLVALGVTLTIGGTIGGGA